MAATTTEINEYLFSIRSAFADYGSNLANAQRIGRTDLSCYQMKFRILKYLIRIMVDYFDSSDYENINFYHIQQVKSYKHANLTIEHILIMIIRSPCLIRNFAS